LKTLNALFFAFVLSFQPFSAALSQSDPYTLSVVSAKPFIAPSLPDLSSFTGKNIAAKIPEKRAGVVKQASMSDLAAFRKFSNTAHFPVQSEAQNTKTPKAIVIQSGVFSLKDLAENPEAKAFIAKGEDGAYVLRRPLYIARGATLILRGENGDKKIRLALSRADGAFIVNSGRFFALDAHVYGWDRELEDYAPYTDEKKFRPFFTSYDGSETYFAQSVFQNLGYGHPKSYGITFSTNDDVGNGLPRPTGWIVNSRFEGLYYGFYSYEAEDVAIVGNTYANSIYYGIDPHDRSRRMTIAENTAFGTKKRHGIILSRNVDDSFVFNNKSFNNGGAGIVVDRTSRNNVIANNTLFENQSYGLALFESPDNYVGGNAIVGNRKDGLRIRNSWNLKAPGNTIMNNGGTGVIINSTDVMGGKRDLKRDPYTKRADIHIEGGVISSNQKANIRFEDVDRLTVSGVTLIGVDGKQIVGDMKLSDMTRTLELQQEYKGVDLVWKSQTRLSALVSKVVKKLSPAEPDMVEEPAQD